MLHVCIGDCKARGTLCNPTTHWERVGKAYLLKQLHRKTYRRKKNRFDKFGIPRYSPCPDMVIFVTFPRSMASKDSTTASVAGRNSFHSSSHALLTSSYSSYLTVIIRPGIIVFVRLTLDPGRHSSDGVSLCIPSSLECAAYSV